MIGIVHRRVAREKTLNLGRVTKQATALLLVVGLGFALPGCMPVLMLDAMTVLEKVHPGRTTPAQAEAEKMRAEAKYAETEAHLRAEAEKDDPGAQSEMGTWYESEGNFTEAATWYRKSADQGWGNAQFRLGVVYERGLGVQQDNVQADAWYCIAAKSEKSTGTATIDAAIYRDDIEKKMTPEQIAEARRRAAEWKSNSSATPGNGPTSSSGVSP